MPPEVQAEDTLALGVARKDAPPAKVQQVMLQIHLVKRHW
ncbi:hypothetical protein LCGC14_2173100 [marine sediment metagenome]|uniref:Uncharacterized protein n=1 Tax=marine sediment metagenome TaxID=412755 RepID=A0A0F9G248_9ZZZZ